MKYNKLKIYLLLLLVFSLVWNGLMIVGPSQARYNNTVVVDTFLSRRGETVSSNCLVSGEGQIILLNDLPAEGRTIQFTLKAEQALSGPLSLTSQMTDYVYVTMEVASGDGTLNQEQVLELPVGGETVIAMTITPTELALTEPREALAVDLTVGFATLQGTFRTVLAAVPGAEEPSEPTEPETEPEIESETEPEIESETEPETEIETEPETKSQTEPETESVTEEQPSDGEEEPINYLFSEPSVSETVTEEPTQVTEPETSEPVTEPQTSEPATEPEIPTVGDEETTIPLTPMLETMSKVEVTGLIPLVITPSEMANTISLGYMKEEAAMPLPAFTRYILDGTSYLLYDGGFVVLTDVSDVQQMLLDLSQTDMATLMLTVQEFFDGTLMAEYSVDLRTQNVQETDNEPVVLHQAVLESMTASDDMAAVSIEFPLSWIEVQELSLAYSLEMLCEQEGTVAYVPVSMDNSGFTARYIRDAQEEIHRLVISVDQGLPPAGTYRLTTRWAYQELCFQTDEQVFYIHYTPAI